MVAVAIAAFDLAAIQALLGPPRDRSLVFGALPMVNILVVAALIGQRRPGSRPFLLGFEVFGAIALALFVVLANSFPDNTGPMGSYLRLGVEPVAKVIGRDR